MLPGTMIEAHIACEPRRFARSELAGIRVAERAVAVYHGV
jgi:hypothetical protein